MSLKFGTSAVNTVTYNGNDVKQIVFNGSSAWCKPYALSVSKGTGVASVTVSRISTLEPTASTGSISAGSGTIFHGDKLSVSATASTGYLLNSYTTSYTVSGNTSVSVTATALPKITLTKNTHVKTISLTYVDSNGTSQTVTTAGTYYAKNGSNYSWSATADDYCYMTSNSSGSGTLSGDITISPTADYGYYTVSLNTIINATAYVNTVASNYSGSVTAKYGSTIYVQVKPNNCYIYTLNSANFTPSSPYTKSYTLNSTNFTLSSTTPATSPTASNIPTATKSIGGSISVAYYKVTLTVTNGTVTSGATTTIRYGDSISYTAKGNSKYYYVNKTTGGYGDSGYSTTYTPTSNILPADGGATSATAVAFTYNVGSCTAYKAYTIKTTASSSCNGVTYVKSVHALGESEFTSKSDSGSSYTVYETDSFYSYGEAKDLGGHKIKYCNCTNNGVSVSPSRYKYLTVAGSSSHTYWTTTTSSTESTGIKYMVGFGLSTAPETVNGNVVISYTGATLTYTYYPYNSNIYSSKINSGTTYVNIYDRNKVSTQPPRLVYYPAEAIRINGCICLSNDSTNTGFSDLPLTTTKTANLKHAGISGTAQMGNQGPASGHSGAAQRQWLSVSKKAGAYKFYIRIWGISIPS